MTYNWTRVDELTCGESGCDRRADYYRDAGWMEADPEFVCNPCRVGSLIADAWREVAFQREVQMLRERDRVNGEIRGYTRRLRKGRCGTIWCNERAEYEMVTHFNGSVIGGTARLCYDCALDHNWTKDGRRVRDAD